jgi:inhibitor of KinA sporulation pathway (predicted exonuclease)
MSKKNLEQIVVVDLEATCWETHAEQQEVLSKLNEKRSSDGLIPLRTASEIIEIGVCFYDVQNKRPWVPHCIKCSGTPGNRCLVCQGKGKVGSIIVKPEHSEINDFCTNLTSLTPEFVNKYGLDFGAACNRLTKYYGPKTRIWASWGDYDKRMFSDQCTASGERYPFGATHWNVKSIQAVLKKLRREIGLGAAVRMAGLDFEGSPHRGDADAYNTARVMQTVL